MRVLLTVLLAGASLVWADPTSQGNFACTANSAVPLTVRPYGIAETLGDFTMVCSGSNPPTGAMVNITLYLNVPVTSRAFTTAPDALEALLLVNEPGSGLGGSPATQIACDRTDTLANNCPADTNVYQGYLTGGNGVTFFGVRIPATASMIIRITNLRGDVRGLSSSRVPATVQAAISVSGLPLPIANPEVVVAYIAPGEPFTAKLLMPDLTTPVPAGGIPLTQCTALNQSLALNPASPTASDGTSFVVRIAESFSTAFKTLSVVSTLPPDVNTRPAAQAQNIPGFIYNTETAFYNPAFPTTGGLSTAGLATQATRIMLRFTSPSNGVQVHAPVYERGKGLLDSRVRLVAASTDGGWPTYSPLGPLSALNTYYTPTLLYVYEVTARAPVSPAQLDTIDLPFYLAETGTPNVTPGGTLVNVTMAPISTDGTPFGTWIPRFADVSTAMRVANLTACPGTAALRTLLSSKSGPTNARVWTIGVDNYGTAPAEITRILGLRLTQTAGAACRPAVSTATPLLVGTLAQGVTAPVPIAINFNGCGSDARFTAAISFSAAGGISGTNTFNDQAQ